MTIGMMQGTTFATMVGFTVTAWFTGFWFFKFGVENPRAGRPTSVADIVSCYQAIMFGMFTVISILNIYPMVVRALTSGHEVLKVIDRVPKIKDKDGGKDVIKLDHGIQFCNVEFRYPTAPEHVKDVFSGVNFTIMTGTSTAIVGPSGSGKSTIVQMLNRFYDPDAGYI